jgi:predicted CXXCH cytochrome family protein
LSRVFKLSGILLMLVLGGTSLLAQAVTDPLGVHDMGPHGQAPITGGLPPCQFCHAPHSAIHDVKPLWTQKLSTAISYQVYADPSMVNQPLSPTLASSSSLCLSCHDGTVAPGNVSPSGAVRMKGSMASVDILTTNLQSAHPFNFQLQNGALLAAPNLLASLSASRTTGNPAVRLKGGNVQCTSCHNPHVQYLDPVAQNFLVMDNSGAALCLACHVSDPGQLTGSVMNKSGAKGTTKLSAAQVVQENRSNPFSHWNASAHSKTTYKVSKGANVGPYGNTRLNGCLACHYSHNGAAGTALLNGPTSPIPNMDAGTQNCANCHNGGTVLSPALPNVFAEVAKSTGHPFPAASNIHNRNESAVLTNNRHATCVDCHDPHGSMPTTSFAALTVRGSQAAMYGVSASDGTTVTRPAAAQYEICLRCHGVSTGKKTLSAYGYAPVRAISAGDPLNLIPQFNQSAKSSHPVMHDRSGALSQPSLLRYMWNVDGHTQGRAMGTRILCTDCHNADDNREFGGGGPNGPHGSKYSHILERRYEFSQVAAGTASAAGPGTTIINLQPAITDPAASGPYSLCAKCHDLANIMTNASFAQHASHIKAGFTCSVCHTAHGNSSNSTTLTGARMVNFDLSVVAVNDSTNSPVSYNGSTCLLKCHNYNHNSDGAVKPAALVGFKGRK